MTVRRWRCQEHGIQTTRILGRGDTSLCDICGRRMAPADDPRTPPSDRMRGEASPT